MIQLALMKATPHEVLSLGVSSLDLQQIYVYVFQIIPLKNPLMLEHFFPSLVQKKFLGTTLKNAQRLIDL